MGTSSGMQEFWDARAREDAFFFVDNRLEHGAPDQERFWSEGETALDGMLEALGTGIGPTDAVVEIGCGLGRLTRPLARRSARVWALDVSSEMLARARDLNPGLDGVEWLLGNGHDLTPIPDEAADACISFVVFQHIPDPAVTLGYVKEMGRVLRPGGRAAFQVSNDPSVHERRAPFRERLGALVGRAPAGQSEAEWLGSAVDLGELRTAADEADMDVERVVGERTQFCMVAALKRGASP